MAIDLTSVVQHANTFPSGQEGNKQIFIRQGAIAEKSGLNIFQRLFSSSAKLEENRATLEAFRESIAANPKYRALLETSEPLARFFQTKHAQGKPLTAREVQQVKIALDMDTITGVGRDLVERGLIPNLDATGFAWFCMGNGFNAGSVEEAKDALKAYYLSQHCDTVARGALVAAGVKPEHLETALKALKASEVWTSALDSAFAGEVTELSRDLIQNRFSQALATASNLLSAMTGQGMQDLIADMATSRNSPNLARFNGTIAAINSGSIAPEQGGGFMAMCVMESRNVHTPELLSAAVRNYCLRTDAEVMFMNFAGSKGLPEGAGKSLAHNPEFTKLADNALLEAFPPPAIPTRENMAAVIGKVAEEFLAEKNDAIRDILALAGKGGGFAPVLAEKTGELTEKFLCEMLNPLLAAPGLVDHLLDPDKGTDLDLIKQLENFQLALVSCQLTVTGEFGGDDIAAGTEKCLAVILGSRGANEATLGRLLDSVQKNFSVIGPGLDTLNSGLMAFGPNRLKTSDLQFSQASVNHVQSTMRRVTYFAHSLTSPTQRVELGVEDDLGDFLDRLESGPGGNPLPLDSLHQSVRAFGQARGIQIAQGSYAETNQLANSEATAFTGGFEQPVVTDLLRERAGIIAGEIGLIGFNPSDLDPVVLGSIIERAIASRNQELLSPAQAREVAEQ
ncbi:MAG: hypothetical protein FWF99_07175, partial [Desulfovibrionaceae bacterium]|nr:hypothetical protein [Desulfovibrionaceae bacterium]